MWDPDAELQDAAEQYAVNHDGRHPYTDAWPWAVAIVGWYRSPQRPAQTSRAEVVLDEDDWALVEAGVAEALRLQMRSRPIGDIPTDLLADELLIWAKIGRDFPAPGETGWPAPTGPYIDRWEALADCLTAMNPERGQRVLRAVTTVLKELSAFSAARPYVRSYGAMADYRLAATGVIEVTLAEVAPALTAGIPIPVRDVAAYNEVAGLETVAAC
ncbi:hypothetical protein [Kitasatospora sp. NRRL B-11411]|uniref:hypothetical protein n=1 Tax=Kitasatospora sp. NRRL B-11411 TaxID=1463822 RepID=UPI0004C422B9|nr:hypothetical protein [Kitasatospora sp. NRRL B-11411]